MTNALLFAVIFFGGADLPFAVQGRVIDQDSKPLAEAEVFVCTPTEVIARVKSEADGYFFCRYHLEPSEFGFRSMSIVAISKNGQWGMSILNPGYPQHSLQQVRITTGPPLSVVVQDPSGNPLADATVSVRSMGNYFLTTPDELANRLFAKTDKTGRASLPNVASLAVGRIKVTHANYGVQTLSRKTSAWSVVKLDELGTIHGTAGNVDRADWPSAKLEITSVRRSENANFRHDTRIVSLDSAGQFRCEMPAGEITITAQQESGNAWISRGLSSLTLPPAGKLVADIPFERGVKVTGIVADRTTKLPIANAMVFLNEKTKNPNRLRFQTKTNAEGIYSMSIPAGEYYRTILPATEYVPALRDSDLANFQIKVPKDVRAFALPKAEVVKGHNITVHVCDPHGRPMPNAWVGQVFPISMRSSSWMGEYWTDENGNVTIPGLPAAGSMRLWAVGGRSELHTDGKVTVDLKTDKVTLTVAPENGFVLQVLVKDSSGNPIPNATVKARQRFRGLGYEAEAWKGQEEISKTGPDGVFRSMDSLARSHEYQIEVSAPGFLPQVISWFSPPTDNQRILMLNAQLRSGSNWTGRVVDAQKKPIAGAELTAVGGVGEAPQTRTNADGRFVFENLNFKGGALTACVKGYASTARPGSLENFEIQLDVAGKNKPIEEREVVDIAERNAVAKRIVEKYATPLLKSGNLRERFEYLIHGISHVDPMRAVELTQSDPILPETTKWRVFWWILPRVAAHHPEEVVPILTSIHDSNERGTAAVRLAPFLPRASRAITRPVLAGAIADCRTLVKPEDRVLNYGLIAEALIESGEPKVAEELLRNELPTAQSLAKQRMAAYARGHFAVALSRFDLAKANELIEGLDKESADREAVRLGMALAELQPGECERIFTSLKSEYQRYKCYAGVCAKMARIDPVRAERMAKSVPTSFDPIAFRVSAPCACGDALADSQPAKAKELIELAWNEVENKHSLNRTSPLIANLRSMHRVAPTMTQENIVRALNCDRYIQPGNDAGTISSQIENGTLVAVFLAPFDRDLARSILQLSAEKIEALVVSKNEYDGFHQRRGIEALTRAFALIDPRAGEQWIKKLPAPKNLQSNENRNHAWLTFLAALGQDPSVIERKLLHETLGLWVPDED